MIETAKLTLLDNIEFNLGIHWRNRIDNALNLFEKFDLLPTFLDAESDSWDLFDGSHIGLHLIDKKSFTGKSYREDGVDLYVHIYWKHDDSEPPMTFKVEGNGKNEYLKTNDIQEAIEYYKSIKTY